MTRAQAMTFAVTFVLASLLPAFAGCGRRAGEAARIAEDPPPLIESAVETEASPSHGVSPEPSLASREGEDAGVEGAPATADATAPALRDPFVPAGTRAPVARPASVASSGMSSSSGAVAVAAATAARRPLQGIMMRGADRYALFGGRFAGVGEIVGGWTITEIGESRCVIAREGVTRTLAPGEAP